MKKLTIFLSAVSSEFHHPDNDQGEMVYPIFVSYRELLAEVLKRNLKQMELDVPFEIITQEESFGYNSGDLLHFLEEDVRRSDIVVHLIGFLPGAKPSGDSLKLFKERNPDFFADSALCKTSLPESKYDQPSFTQWECYVALDARSTSDDRKSLLIYELDEIAPRSPRCTQEARTEEASTNMKTHIDLLDESGIYRKSNMADHRHLAVNIYRTLLGLGSLKPPTWVASSEEDLQRVQDLIDTIILEIAKRIKDPDKRNVPVKHPGLAITQGYKEISNQYNIHPDELVRILQKTEEEKQRAWEEDIDVAALYDAAFAKFALGDYQEARNLAKIS